jgi:monovalent cation:H+ antiporter, CPA1 family
MLEIAVWCLVITALFAYINHRFIGLPTTVGVMAIALVISGSLVILDYLGWSAPRKYQAEMMASIDFPGVLMRGMLAVLLFAGGLQAKLAELRRFSSPIGALALVGTAASAFLVGIALWKLLPVVGITLSLPYCMVFGALISPTDAVAVGSILKSAGVPRTMEAIISGESLFNDAVGVVLFALALSMIKTGDWPTLNDALGQVLREGGGGIFFGLILGQLLYRMLRDVQSYQVEVLLTLATVMGGYGLADEIDVSGPLAMVVVGMVVGTKSRSDPGFPSQTRDHLSRFWVLFDGILNTVLFVLIGLEVVRVHFNLGLLAAAALTIVITLVARGVTVAGLQGFLRLHLDLPKGSWWVLTWSGVRGGVSVALALSLPAGHHREIVLSLTYCVVVFSILVQGLTVGGMARRVGELTMPVSPGPEAVPSGAVAAAVAPEVTSQRRDAASE